MLLWSQLPVHGRVLPSKEISCVDCKASLCDSECCIAVLAAASTTVDCQTTPASILLSSGMAVCSYDITQSLLLPCNCNARL